MRSVTLVIAALAGLGLAAPNARRYENYEVHEKRSVTPTWVKRGRVHRDVKLPMRIGLTQTNADNIHDLLMDVSHPDSENYGKHWTEREVIERFAPSTEAVDSVRAWLRSTGVSDDRISISVNKQWIQFDARTSEAEDLLNTKYHFYEHKRTGANTIASDEYHLPNHLREHIDYITPGIKTLASDIQPTKSGEIEKRTSINRRAFRPRPPLDLPMPKSIAAIKAAGPLANCDSVVTPECIRALYKIPEAKRAKKGNELGIFEDLGDVYDQQDLDQFFSTYYPRIPNGTHPILDLIDGAVAPTTVDNAGLESLLDFEISYPIIWPQNSVLYQVDDPVYEANYTYQGFLNNLFDAIDGSYCSFSAYGETGNSNLDPPYPDPSNEPGAYKGSLQCGKYKATNVISISYGGPEADLPISYQRRQCLEIAKLGLQGISVINSSGDDGVQGPEGDPSPNGCLGKKGNIFAPSFPATCPYLTALGSTFLPPGANVNNDEEIATTRFPSGGGFSNIYAQPAYQLLAVQKYLLQYKPPYPSYFSIDNSSFGANGGIYNRAGRGYPDFAAIGDRVAIVGGGRPRLIGGTSASAPAFAAIITRINDERLQVGKSTIGFMNPVLYASPWVLHDITNGTNPGCGTQGFSAAPGWDPVTGYGTPIYPAMLKLFLDLPGGHYKR